MAAAERADAAARARIRDDLDATLFVEAAAGTGKTTCLVGRIVSLLRAGRGQLERIAAVTFTEKAAGEMKLRLRAEIERARSDPSAGAEGRRRLDAALEGLEGARIGTIHAFCGDLLRERPVEAGVDPLFEVAPEDEAARLLDRAFDDWFERSLADPPEGVRRVLRRRPRGFGAPGPRAELRQAAAALVEHRDFDAAWSRPPFERDAAIDRAMQELAEVAALAGRAARSADWLARSLAEIGRFVQENALREAVRGRDHDGLEAELRELVSGRQRHWRWTGGQRPYAAELSRQQVLERRDAARRRVEALLAACDADLAPRLREELRPVVAAYDALKQRAGMLDFVDLLIRARDLLVRDRAVRVALQQRFTHFFVDEFQDTDPLQAEILLLLAADDPDAADWREARPIPGKLFLVGDPKQSIYRFRRADVAIYEATRRRLAAQGAAVLRLTASFRAVPSLQRAVNAAFAPRMQACDDGSQAEYVPLEPVRAEAPGQPALVALPVPRPYADYGDRASIRRWRIDESYPDAVGAFVDWLVRKSGWSVSVPGSDARQALAARHVCLLFRRFKSWGDDVTRPYVRALEARGVPHVLVGGRSFHDREEVMALRNALVALEWPDDELRVYATLRGPLFALGDDRLLAYRHERGSLHPLAPRDPATAHPEVAEALDVLGGLHRGRNRRPIAETLVRLLGAVRAHAGIAIWPTGEQALANCLRIVDSARLFERRGAASFRAFVERLEEEAERGEAEDAPIVEEGTEGVRLMTVHRAKGLEFPVVILADPTCRAYRDQPSRHVEPERRLWAEPLCGCAPRELLDCAEEEVRRDRAEALRLAYVAATRARDLLVAPALGDPEPEAEEERWLDALAPALYPPASARRDARPAPGCPRFGDDSVVDRPRAAGLGPRASVAPGLHRPQRGDHEVVWWDPHSLELDREEEVGLRQQRMLEADAAGEAAGESARAHEAWQTSRRRALEAGATPWLSVASATEWAARATGAAPGPEIAVERTAAPGPEIAVERTAAPGPEVAVERTAAPRGERPHGRRFGTLVHAVLAAVDLRAGAEELRDVAALQARLVGAPPEEALAAARAVEAALAHPLLARAARSPALRRETPLWLDLGEGALVEGVLDLAFREEGEAAGSRLWSVVDFKTDRDPEPHLPVYRAQVGLYVRAVEAATGQPARGYLLLV